MAIAERLVGARQEAEPKPGHEILVVAHGYQPPSEYFLPASETRVFIRRQINESIFERVYRPLLVEDNNVLQATLTSFYGTQREWVRRNKQEEFEQIRLRFQINQDHLLGDTGIHPILPLLSKADQDTVVKIGRRWLERDFGFAPKAIWVPEAAISSATLGVLVENGYKAVILRDHQLKDTRKNPMYVRTGNGGEIAVFHMHRRLGEKVSFDKGFTYNGDAFFNDLRRDYGKTVAFATDFENYGGYEIQEKADFLRYISQPDVLRSNDFSTFNVDDALNDPEHEYTEIHENSSWTCDHSLGRWTGAPECNDDSPTPERQDEKRRLFGTLTFYGRQIDERLDGLSSTWRDVFVDFFLDTEGLMTSEEWNNYMEKNGLKNTEFGRLLQAKKAQLRGMTSCAYYYTPLHGIETVIAYTAIPEIEIAAPDIERADWRRDVKHEREEEKAA